MAQVEVSRTIVFDAPRHARGLPTELPVWYRQNCGGA
jgi:hypothetical protein